MLGWSKWKIGWLFKFFIKQSEPYFLQAGDKIIKINGESAYQIKTADVVKKLKGPKGTKVEITIQRKGQEPFNRSLVRDKIPIKSVISYFKLDENVGYVKLSRFSKKIRSSKNCIY